ncbi:hypothetical protein PG997_010527 [Apiospora hydei]|uniref:Nephrocystin 3-like N-terminal domain-containing protein n=1 Tax=Apiospora hydei TaxID=1337664 RepID=A0ABR1VX99_9PEZI
MSANLQQTQLMGLKMQVRSHEADKRQRSEEEERIAKELAKEQDEFRWQMLEWISTTDFRGVQDEKLDNTLDGTAQWLLDDDRFKDWKLQSRPNRLYLHGKAGSGKSHLAAKLIRDVDLWCREQNASLAKVETQISREQNANASHAKMESHLAGEQNTNVSLAKVETQLARGEENSSITKLENQRKYAMAYIYCGANMTETSGHKNLDRTSEPRSGAAAILSSILRQLYSYLPRDQDVEFLRDLCRQNQSSNPSIEDVRESIRLIVAKFARTFIVVR